MSAVPKADSTVDGAADPLRREIVADHRERPANRVAGGGRVVGAGTRRAHDPLEVNALARAVDAAIGERDAVKRATVGEIAAAAAPICVLCLVVLRGERAAAGRRKRDEQSLPGRAHLEQGVALPAFRRRSDEAQATAPLLVRGADRELARATVEETETGTGDGSPRHAAR